MLKPNKVSNEVVLKDTLIEEEISISGWDQATFTYLLVFIKYCVIFSSFICGNSSQNMRNILFIVFGNTEKWLNSGHIKEH